VAASADLTIRLLADVRNAQQALQKVSSEMRALQTQSTRAGAATSGRGGILSLLGGGNHARMGTTAGRSFGAGLRSGMTRAFGGSSSGGALGGLLAGGGVLAGGGAVLGFMLKSASEFTDSWVEVQKVVNGADDALQKTAFNVAHNFGVNPNKVASVMAIGGQMNVPQSELEAFTTTMIQAGMATDMTAENAANMAGQFSNAMGEIGAGKWQAILSTADALADIIPGGESAVLDIAQRFALAGKTAGLSSSQVLGYSAFVRGVGIDPEMGASALTRMFIALAETGSAGRGASAPDPITVRDATDKAGDLTGDLTLAEERRKEMYSSKTGRLLKQYRKHPAEVMAADMQIERLKRQQQYAQEAMDEAAHPGQKMAKNWAAMAGMTLADYSAGVASDPNETMIKVFEGLQKEQAAGNLFPALGRLGINDIREIQTIAPMINNLDTPGTGLRALLATAGTQYADPTKLATDATRVQQADTFAKKQAEVDLMIAAIEKGMPLLHQESLDIQAAMTAMATVSAGGNPLQAGLDFSMPSVPPKKVG
jgi:Phage-related minor tail protein